MEKKNIYLVQPTFMSTSSVYFPYAIGALASYAFNFRDIEENYELKEVFFLRDKITDIVSSLKNPFLVGFSNYIWNYEYNKILAFEVKKAFPDCIILFGGQQITESTDLLTECPFIDILMHFEGEVPFRDLLRAYINNTSLESVSNISFRTSENEIVTTPFKVYDVADFPSPFASGFFDMLCEKHPEIDFVPLVETNRGCPNRCAYCSWGMIKSKVRFFPLERVFADIEWASRRKPGFLGIADANFGMFERDEIIADKIIECNKKYGYPKKFQVSYSKGNKERVFRISKKLNEMGMDKGVTLSFQSMSPEVQKNIGRSNLDIDAYTALQKKYSEEGIPTYTDLILGLPGETVESFRNGIDRLLELGQHNSLFVHLCEWLPLAEMGRRDYMDKHKISYSRIPLNQPHVSAPEKDDICEYSRIVTSTASMTTDDWKEMVLFSTCVLCFHHLGLLQYVAIYLHFENGIPYSEFYGNLLSFLLNEAESDVFRDIRNRISSVIECNAEAVVYDETFGDAAWPFEEYAFLRTVYDIDSFYNDIRRFIARYITDSALLGDLLSYQKFVIKSVNDKPRSVMAEHDWKSYFSNILAGSECRPLETKKVCYSLHEPQAVHSWAEYAREVLWYGRRGGKNIYTSEIKEEKQS
ncbi:MAG: radical SAM protein [Clostridia bacterium]|nr:radical SAM protein [Clostridia bacterium]